MPSQHREVAQPVRILTPQARRQGLELRTSSESTRRPRQKQGRGTNIQFPIWDVRVLNSPFGKPTRMSRLLGSAPARTSRLRGRRPGAERSVLSRRLGARMSAGFALRLFSLPARSPKRDVTLARRRLSRKMRTRHKMTWWALSRCCLSPVSFVSHRKPGIRTVLRFEQEW